MALQASCFHAIPYELRISHRPISKRIVCVAGGMLLFFDTMQPHRLIGSYNSSSSGESMHSRRSIEGCGLGVGLCKTSASTAVNGGGVTAKLARVKKNDVPSVQLGAAIIKSVKGPELSQTTFATATAKLGIDYDYSI